MQRHMSSRFSYAQEPGAPLSDQSTSFDVTNSHQTSIYETLKLVVKVPFLAIHYALCALTMIENPWLRQSLLMSLIGVFSYLLTLTETWFSQLWVAYVLGNTFWMMGVGLTNLFVESLKRILNNVIFSDVVILPFYYFALLISMINSISEQKFPIIYYYLFPMLSYLTGHTMRGIKSEIANI